MVDGNDNINEEIDEENDDSPNKDDSIMGTKIDLDWKAKLPKFNGSDFAVWRAQVEAHLTSRGIYEVLLEEFPEERPSTSGVQTRKKTEIDEKFIRIDKYVRSLILNSLDNKHAKLLLSNIKESLG